MNGMKIAVAGYGMMGSSHIASLKSLGRGTDLVLGRDSERTEEFASLNGIPCWSTDPRDLLREGIEVLHVCTPPLQHYDLIKLALENGIHVICEKPFVLDERQGSELAELAEKKNRINAVGFNVRFHEACRNMHGMVGNGGLGEILLVNGSYMQEFHALPCPFSWRYNQESAGALLATTEIGSHWIDLMRFLSGREVTAVSATYGHFCADRVVRDGMQYPAGSTGESVFHLDSDNVAIVTFRLDTGALANMVLSEITPGRYNFLDICLTGTEGSGWWNSEDPNRFKTGKKNEPISEHVLAFGDGFHSSVTNMLAEVYDDIERERHSEHSIYATFRDGLVNTKICSAIRRSAEHDSAWEIVL